jgi:hypothetical protein
VHGTNPAFIVVAVSGRQSDSRQQRSQLFQEKFVAAKKRTLGQFRIYCGIEMV